MSHQSRVSPRFEGGYRSSADEFHSGMNHKLSELKPVICPALKNLAKREETSRLVNEVLFK